MRDTDLHCTRIWKNKKRNKKIKLQLALDLVDIPVAIEVVTEVGEYIDIVEIGTPVINKEGLAAVREVKAAFPELE